MNSGRSESRISYSKFGEAKHADINVIKNTRNFRLSEEHLLRHYSHFLRSPVAKSIFIEEDPNGLATVYNIIYATRGATFLAILRFDKVKDEPEIKSLVVA